jgi:hypothetical protein
MNGAAIAAAFAVDKLRAFGQFFWAGCQMTPNPRAFYSHPRFRDLSQDVKQWSFPTSDGAATGYSSIGVGQAGVMA